MNCNRKSLPSREGFFSDRGGYFGLLVELGLLVLLLLGFPLWSVELFLCFFSFFSFFVL